MGKIIKAISLWEPWASLVMTGAKQWETRSWPTSYRGDLLICAAKKKDKEAMQLLYSPSFKTGLRPLLEPALNDEHDNYVEALHFGKAVAIVNLIDCIPSDYIVDKMGQELVDAQFPFGDYRDGRFVWIFDSIRAISNPFNVKGSQGFFTVEVPSDISQRIFCEEEVTEQELSRDFLNDFYGELEN